MRVKGGFVLRRRHNKFRRLAKGFLSRRKSCFTFVRDSVDKSMQDAFGGRRQKKRDFRSLWIVRIGAAARESGISYSRFMDGLRRANITLNRKSLAELAIKDPQAFAAVASQAKAALG